MGGGSQGGLLVPKLIVRLENSAMRFSDLDFRRLSRWTGLEAHMPAPLKGKGDIGKQMEGNKPLLGGLARPGSSLAGVWTYPPAWTAPPSPPSPLGHCASLSSRWPPESLLASRFSHRLGRGSNLWPRYCKCVFCVLDPPEDGLNVCLTICARLSNPSVALLAHF